MNLLQNPLAVTRRYFRKAFHFLCLCQILTFQVKAQSKPAAATDNIIVTTNSAVIDHLTAIGPAETTKSAFMGGKDGLNKKAELELKQQALAKGGNIVFVTGNEFINDPNSYFKKVHMTGVVYKSDGKINPSSGNDPSQTIKASTFSDSTRTLVPGVSLSITDCIGDPVAQTVTLYFTFNNSSNIDRSVSVYGGPHSSSGIIANYIQKSSIFDDNSNQYECKDDFYFVSGKELPPDLKYKGMIVFSNVLPGTKLIALAKLSVEIADWEHEAHMQRFMVSYKNLAINWGGKPAEQRKPTIANWDTKIKNLNNGIDFTVTGCRGEVRNQTVTIYYTFSNPRKSNQRVVVQNGFNNNAANAFDKEGTQYPFKTLSLAEASSDRQIEKELPTGLTLKGSITFSNVLPSVGGLAMAKIPVQTSNWDGGGNEIFGMIEVQNIAINWITRQKK